MTLSAIIIITLIAAIINGIAVAGALSLMWEMPAQASVVGLQRSISTDGNVLTNMLRAESWVELTTIDTPLVRERTPARTPIPMLSWGDIEDEADDEMEELLRKFRKAS